MGHETKHLIRVLIVDDQRLIRDGLHYLIDSQNDMQVVGEADTGETGIVATLEMHPDIVLMDVQMPGKGGLDATRRITAAMPGVKILLLTTFDMVEYVYDGIRAGAVGYLLKDIDAAELMDSIRAVYRGQALYRTGAAAEALARAVKEPTGGQVRMTSSSGTTSEEPATATDGGCEGSLVDGLTEREREVLQEMAWGRRNDEIARKLHISEGTVKTHVHRILQKFGVDDRTQAVVLALRRGMVQ
ncbi:response regulator transcription factor [Alicyclobacillus sp. ALC3]|uniref:response regulator transcription factor n=1 Tax=Alicyclobacillus sp. ALC3 TaxID=2796143 RepID=UPI00237825BA|nr:response regulator transcription factor [Alicyclobacillus sp. ALC3]WDL97611.1 response regulator transcription factor [Alicyclobacillus sp. ALC3]